MDTMAYKFGLAGILICCANFAPVAADAGKLTTIYAFKGAPDAAEPVGSLTMSDGLLYGASLSGGETSKHYPSGAGTVFSINPTTGVETIIHTFKVRKVAGSDYVPMSGVLPVHRHLYGETSFLGGNGEGAIYRMSDKKGRQTVLASISPFDYNGLPQLDAGMMLHAGAIYGVDPAGAGELFKIDPNTNVLTNIYTFSAADYPSSTPTFVGHKIYGTTLLGGHGYGVIYQVDLKTGIEKDLYDFEDRLDGELPVGSVAYSNGSLYGTTEYCQNGCLFGTIWKYDLSTNTFTNILDFDGQSQDTDSAQPEGGLTVLNGILYGRRRRLSGNDIQLRPFNRKGKVGVPFHWASRWRLPGLRSDRQWKSSLWHDSEGSEWFRYGLFLYTVMHR
jgi:uncharacterized repeat protein (TIGR03803 family)